MGASAAVMHTTLTVLATAFAVAAPLAMGQASQTVSKAREAVGKLAALLEGQWLAARGAAKRNAARRCNRARRRVVKPSGPTPLEYLHARGPG